MVCIYAKLYISLLSSTSYNERNVESKRLPCLHLDSHVYGSSKGELPNCTCIIAAARIFASNRERLTMEVRSSIVTGLWRTD
jgi:hypothetical protein